MHAAVAMMLTLTIVLSLYALLRYATRVYMRFRLPSQEVITGRFSSHLGGSSGRAQRMTLATHHCRHCRTVAPQCCSSPPAPLVSCIIAQPAPSATHGGQCGGATPATASATQAAAR